MQPLAHEPDVDPTEVAPPKLEESRIRKSAARWLLIAMAVFMIWAFFAPIDAGVPVQGTVTVLGHRKAVQHPKGGVIEEILVREGAVVKQGDLLIKMNPLTTEAELTTVELQYIALLATESRLLSERAGKSEIVWVPELQRMGNDTRVQETKLLHSKLFSTRVEDIQAQQKILREQIAGLEALIGGLNALHKERLIQLKIQQEEFKNNSELAAEGYVPRSRANELARQVSEMLGGLESAKAEIAKTQNSIAAARLQLIQVRTNYHKDIESQLSETQKLREALQSKVESLRFELKLTELRAPVSGTVVGTKVHTVGGIVPAGQTIMEVVPIEQNLIVEAKVPPHHIDKLRVGLPADLRFTAFPLATTPVVEGSVRLVGADRLKEGDDEFYLCQLQLTPEGLSKLKDLKIQAGMPVDVVVKTGERTFMSYIIKPITDRFAQALKER